MTTRRPATRQLFSTAAVAGLPVASLAADMETIRLPAARIEGGMPPLGALDAVAPGRALNLASGEFVTFAQAVGHAGA